MSFPEIFPYENVSIRLHFAINNAKTEEALDLIRSGINLDLEVYGRTPLGLAIIKEQFDIACTLVENGASLVHPDNSNQLMFPIHLASRSGNTNLIQKIVERLPGCIHQRDALQFTPLHWASAMGHLNAVMLLVNKTADIDAIDDTLKAPLHRAVENNKVEVVRFLVAKNARASMQDSNGWTALSSGVVCGNVEITEMMLKARVSPNIKNRFDQNSLHLSSFPRSNANLWALCRSMMESTNRHLRATIPSIRNYSCLPQVSQFVHIASLLIDHGVNIYHKDYNHNSPFSLALKSPNVDLAMITLMLNAGCFLKWTQQEEQTLADRWRIKIHIPPSLTFLCKFVIRMSLEKDISKKILMLPLPGRLKNYLQLSSTDLDLFVM